jgi:predicted methyltransferase MtxX (methanogen marker protein 4)
MRIAILASKGNRTVESDNHQQEESDVTVEIVENEQDYTMIVERQEKARWDSLMEETKKAQVLLSTRLTDLGASSEKRFALLEDVKQDSNNISS